jgi:hypothetical protein
MAAVVGNESTDPEVTYGSCQEGQYSARETNKCRQGEMTDLRKTGSLRQKRGTPEYPLARLTLNITTERDENSLIAQRWKT